MFTKNNMFFMKVNIIMIKETIISNEQETPFDSQEFLYHSLLGFLGKTNLKTLTNHIAKVFANFLNVHDAALFVDSGDGYKVQGAYSVRKVKIQSGHLAQKSPFIRRLKKINKVLISRYQGDFSVEEFKVLYLKKTLFRFDIEYVIILKHKKFTGFLLLGKRKSPFPPALKSSETAIVNHLAYQAGFALEYMNQSYFVDKLENELKQANKIRDYFFEQSEQGMMFIDYGSERIVSINRRARDMFATGAMSIIGKKIADIIEKHSSHEFALFLERYKKAKLLRRSFRLGVFQREKLTIWGKVFVANSTFIIGVNKKRVGDLITIVRG